MEKYPVKKRFKSNNEELHRIIARFLFGGMFETLLSGNKVHNDIAKFRTLFDSLGFRTTIIESPRKSMTVYLDSCECIDNTSPKAFFATIIGMNPMQADLEMLYRQSVRDIWCLMLFCKRINNAVSLKEPNKFGGDDLHAILKDTIRSCKSFIKEDRTPITYDHRERTIEILKIAAAVDDQVRMDQLQRELHRIQSCNSTLSNALARLLFDFHETNVKDVVFKQSHLPRYQRLSFSLYDPDFDELKPPQFLFLPCLYILLRKGCKEIVNLMVDAFWMEMLERGYFASASARSAIEPNLKRYIESGLTQNPSIPVLVNGHFTPSFPLSFYFHGKTGAGKSRLVRSFGPSLNAILVEYIDPEILVRFVKQNLNKSHETLRLELDLRPNNNDMSVMSIIQSRRMTLGQSKPGLVVVGFEEMPSFGPNRDPEQLTTCQLISQRFAGRKGEYTEGSTVSTNNAKRFISGDATIVTMFTSNYDLEESSADALRRLDMFQQLCRVPIQAISGQDRTNFAKYYVSHCLEEKGWTTAEISSIDLNLDFGHGDTRPLVRQLRMLAFYLNRVKCMKPIESNLVVSHTHDGGCIIQSNGTTMIKLTKSEYGNLYASTDSDYAAHKVATSFTNQLQGSATQDELCTIVSFWLENVLSPTVIVTQNNAMQKTVIAGLLEIANTTDRKVKVMPSIDVTQYKMMKSLYDGSETKNLKDDIVALGGGKGDPFVVTLVCPTMDSQFCIREMIEDSPSQTAFSSEKTVLHKDGILFVVMIHGGDVTSEVRSRASIIL